jgi:hypothetical protein
MCKYANWIFPRYLFCENLMNLRFRLLVFPISYRLTPIP